MKSLGDRRSAVRLEVVGSLWGVLENGERARVVNLSTLGALIVAPSAMTVDSFEIVLLRFHGKEIRLQTRVRHLAAGAGTLGRGGEQGVGLEFLDTPVELIDALTGLEQGGPDREKSTDS